MAGGYFDELDDFGLTIKRRCELLGIKRSVAYQKSKTPNLKKIFEEEYIKHRLDYWHTHYPTYGVRKLKVLLAEHDGIFIGRKRIKRLMTEMGIYVIYPKPNLSKPNKLHKLFPYLLRNKSIDFPNQVWAIDITYIPMKRGHMYLTAIIDWYSRYIVGWSLADTLGTEPILTALKKAINTYGTPSIINTDQGSQFTSDDYTQVLKSLHIRQSMDGKGRWVDNVIIERWFRSLKTECIYINEYETPRELREGITKYILEYNEIRPHQTFDYATPKEIYEAPFSVAA